MSMLRAIPKTRTKILMNNNVVTIVSNARFMQNLSHNIYKSIPHYIPTSLSENSFTGHNTSNTIPQQKIMEIMTSKARIYVSMKKLQALQKRPAKYFELEGGVDRFHLLRQNGYHTTADIKKFKDKSSQLVTQEPEEEILIDEACDVSELLQKASLNYIAEHSNARMIMENTSLHNPYHKNFASLLVQNFLHNVDVSLILLQYLN